MNDLERRGSVLVVVVAMVVSMLVGSLATYAVLQWTHRINNLATFKVLGVGVYKDVNLTVPVTQIDWGIVEAGESKNSSVFIKNESNVPVALSMYTEDWQPANASVFISLAWSYDGNTLGPEQSVSVIFTLSVNASTSGLRAFSFTIVLVGSG